MSKYVLNISWIFEYSSNDNNNSKRVFISNTLF